MPRLVLKIMLGGHALGPGKIELLEKIETLGSISAAGREMEMSYKRAWLLVEEMNSAFSKPLVQSNRGGAGGGGALLTETGQTVLSLYKSISRKANETAQPDLAKLRTLFKAAG